MFTTVLSIIMYPVSFLLFPHILPDMTRSQTHSHTLEPKTDTTTSSSGSSINTAVVFLFMIQMAQKLIVWLYEGRGL